MVASAGVVGFHVVVVVLGGVVVVFLLGALVDVGVVVLGGFAYGVPSAGISVVDVAGGIVEVVFDDDVVPASSASSLVLMVEVVAGCGVVLLFMVVTK